MKKIYVAFLVVLLASLLYGCNICRKNDHTKTEEIGPDGGGIITESGAVLVVPPGALASTTEITITDFKDKADLPGNQFVYGSLAGGMALSPEGLEFQSLVRITIPLNRALENQEGVKVFYYRPGDEGSTNYPGSFSGWEQLDHPVIISPDGKSAMVHIDHFSTYIITMGFGEDTLDILGNSVETLGDNGLSLDFHAYQEYFESHVAKIGDLHVHDLPEPYGYACYEVVGLEYRLYHNLDAIYEQPMLTFKGDEGEVGFKFMYNGDRILNDEQFVYDLFITVHVDRTYPDIGLTTGDSRIKPGEQTSITCSLMCGTEPMVDQEIYFEANELGSVRPDENQTDDNGAANTQFRAGNSEGVALVKGEYVALVRGDMTVDLYTGDMAVISDVVSIIIDDDEEPVPDPELPAFEVWSFQKVNNYDSYSPDPEIGVSATSRQTIDGTFEVHFEDLPNMSAQISGTAIGVATYTKSPYEWAYEIGPGPSYGGSCPGSSRTQTKEFIVTGYVEPDRERVQIYLHNTDAEHAIQGIEICDTWDGPGERRVSYYLFDSDYGVTLPYEEGLTIVVDNPYSPDEYMYISWELNKVSSSP